MLGFTLLRKIGITLMDEQSSVLSKSQRFYKRLLDIAISLILILIFLPVIVVLTLLIKLSSTGPAIIYQVRVGEGGKHFVMYKFRTMVCDPKEIQYEIHQEVYELKSHKTPDDPRITPFGHVLRRSSLDELPQLFNVLKGDMSLIGPRPELPWIVEQYNPRQYERTKVPQGITGWWQIHGRGLQPMHLHTEYDLYYIQHYSLFLDLYILLRTVPAVLLGIGAY